MTDDFLSEQTRAEDILLGSLGFAEDAKIISLQQSENGYSGKAQFPDGEQVDFSYQEELDEFQTWALKVLKNLTP